MSARSFNLCTACLTPYRLRQNENTWWIRGETSDELLLGVSSTQLLCGSKVYA